jgi:hypothetical protein
MRKIIDGRYALEFGNGVATLTMPCDSSEHDGCMGHNYRIDERTLGSLIPAMTTTAKGRNAREEFYNKLLEGRTPTEFIQADGD